MIKDYPLARRRGTRARALGPVDVTEREVTREDIRFTLPKRLYLL